MGPQPCCHKELKSANKLNELRSRLFLESLDFSCQVPLTICPTYREGLSIHNNLTLFLNIFKMSNRQQWWLRNSRLWSCLQTKQRSNIVELITVLANVMWSCNHKCPHHPLPPRPVPHTAAAWQGEERVLFHHRLSGSYCRDEVKEVSLLVLAPGSPVNWPNY